MISGVRTTATVQPGGLVEIRSDELQEGATVEVIVLVQPSEELEKKELADFLGAATGSFSSVAEIDAYIREERDSWDD